MFYGRISDVYLGVITLTVTLILFNSVNSTAGPRISHRHGAARRLQRHPEHAAAEHPGRSRTPRSISTACSICRWLLLLVVYFGLRGCSRAASAASSSAIRENEQRAEFLGYDARLHKLVAFTIGGALAGLAGCLFANWGNFVSPTAFSVVQSAQIIIWVMVGGAGTLLGPVIGAVGISWLTARNRHADRSSTPTSCSAPFCSSSSSWCRRAWRQW